MDEIWKKEEDIDQMYNEWNEKVMKIKKGCEKKIGRMYGSKISRQIDMKIKKLRREIKGGKRKKEEKLMKRRCKLLVQQMEEEEKKKEGRRLQGVIRDISKENGRNQ